jgi:hypothetical protein
MKVRMIFAHEHVPEGSSEKELLKVNSTPDLPDDVAKRLIAEGRAEPVKLPKANKKDEKGE